jgi:AraC-like DNA-binding protein
MTLATDMLAETTATVAAVARRLGYADAFGFSAAFKRIHGMSPSEHRKLAQSPGQVAVANGHAAPGTGEVPRQNLSR